MVMINGKMHKPVTFGFYFDKPERVSAFDMQILYFVQALMFRGKTFSVNDTSYQDQVCFEQKTFSITISNQEILEHLGFYYTIDSSIRLVDALEKLKSVVFSFRKGLGFNDKKILHSLYYNVADPKALPEDIDKCRWEVTINFNLAPLDAFVSKNFGIHD